MRKIAVWHLKKGELRNKKGHQSADKKTKSPAKKTSKHPTLTHQQTVTIETIRLRISLKKAKQKVSST